MNIYARESQRPHFLSGIVALPVFFKSCLPAPPDLSAACEQHAVGVPIVFHVTVDIASVPCLRLDLDCAPDPGDRRGVGGLPCADPSGAENYEGEKNDRTAAAHQALGGEDPCLFNLVTIHLAVLHHELYLFEHTDIFERIPLDGNDIGKGSRNYFPPFPAHLDKLGADPSLDLNRLHGR